MQMQLENKELGDVQEDIELHDLVSITSFILFIFLKSVLI